MTLDDEAMIGAGSAGQLRAGAAQPRQGVQGGNRRGRHASSGGCDPMVTGITFNHRRRREMNVADKMKEQLQALRESLKTALTQARDAHAEALHKTLQEAIARAEEFNKSADNIFDKGLDAIEQSRYTAPIVVGISLAMLTVGGLMGWGLKSRAPTGMGRVR
ncbi:hypothetical protein [Nitrosospira sp. NpAV]|uniref:hypothetical protein n=1 Tax=Nitrosospira sp. NpAV TaxID=58133 RepID=UPI0012EC16C7|nr:hypothetical protein [Nitrosospira sp. NpAV]